MTFWRAQAPAPHAYQEGLASQGAGNQRYTAASEYFWNDTPSLLRVLIICGGEADDGRNAGRNADVPIASRLTQAARRVVQRSGAVADVLDLNWGEPNDQGAKIEERWWAAHGVVILAPACWQASTSPLKMMMDGMARNDCDIVESPGRSFGIVVHSGTDDGPDPESSRRSLCELLETLGLVAANGTAGIDRGIDRYSGYYEPPLAPSDFASRELKDEVSEVARSVVGAARKLRAARPFQGSLA